MLGDQVSIRSGRPELNETGTWAQVWIETCRSRQKRTNINNGPFAGGEEALEFTQT